MLSLFKSSLILVVFNLFSTLAAIAQFNTSGNDFWLSFLESVGSYTTIELAIYISAENSTSGTVDVPLLGLTYPFTVAAGSAVRIDIPTTIGMNTLSETIESRGIHVTSNDPVSVYALNHHSQSTDATIVLPTKMLSSDYIITSYKSEPSWSNSEFLIVAVEDFTLIEIIPTSITLAGNPANVPFYVELNAGETYQVGSSIDLTGSLVRGSSTGCKKFAVFAGNECTFVPNSCAACDHLFEQMIPTSNWGTYYISVPLKTRTGDEFVIIAKDDNTIVSLDGVVAATLNSRESFHVDLYIPTVIEGDKPISVAQFSRGSSCDFVSNADPFIVMLAPVEQSIDYVTFDAFATSTFASNYLNILIPSASIGSTLLDGVPFPVSDFSTVPSNPLYSYAQLDISIGTHTMESTQGFTAYIYSYGPSESYGYTAGSSLINLEISPSVVLGGDTIPYYLFEDSIPCATDLGFVVTNPDSSYLYTWILPDGSTQLGTQSNWQFINTGLACVFLLAQQICSGEVDTFKIPIVSEGYVENNYFLEICSDGAFILDPEVNDDQELLWSTGETTATISVAEGGVYWVDILEDSCIYRDSFMLTIFPLPQVSLPASAGICPADEETIELSVDGEWAAILWSDSSTESSVLLNSIGPFSVMVTDTNGCQAFASTEIFETCTYYLDVPNAFSPNGDGVNDYFAPVEYGVIEYSCLIYDRWGKVVFESFNLNRTWDGSYKGVTQDIGSYVFHIQYRLENNPMEELTKQGNLTLVR